MTMEKSAIALKMTNGTGQFIRDYMFPKSEGDTIETISEQLGAYRDIKEKIDVLEDKIGMLKKVREAGQKLTMTRADIVKQQAMIRCIDIEDLKIRIDALLQDQERTQERLRELRQKEEELESLSTQLENELIVVSADLKSSDLGSRQEHLEELEKRSRMLADNAAQWRKILQGLKRWESDEIVADYISNRLLNKIGAFCTGPVTQKQCLELRSRLEEERQNIEEEYETYHEQERQLSKELKEKQKLLDDMKNNRKSYPEILTKARTALEQKLTALYGRTVKVWIFADLFDVEEEEWKNAVEGRLGRLKLSLITEPNVAADAAAAFREMRQFEEVDLINSEAVTKSDPTAEEGSLYETVRAGEPFADSCLKRYLGRIMKCRTVEELRTVKDGVTPDCYSYSNFIFRHLKKRDYTVGACIGSKVSRARQQDYEADAQRLRKELDEAKRMADGLKAVREMESLKEDPAYLESLSRAAQELEAVLLEKQEAEATIESLREGAYKELEEKEAELRKKRSELKKKMTGMQNEIAQQTGNQERIRTELQSKNAALKEAYVGYTAAGDHSVRAGGVVEAFLRLGQSTEKCRDRGAWRKGAGTDRSAVARKKCLYSAVSVQRIFRLGEIQ